MAEPIIRINKVLRELNISLERAVDFLKSKNIIIVANPNTKINDATYCLLAEQFGAKNTKNRTALLELDSKKNNAISNSSSKIIINSHRDFTVLEQKERSTILKDCLTHATYPCRKISKLVGDFVKMQVVSLEDPEKPKFSYSVLNDFNENKEYDFDVVEKKEKGFRIENSEDFSSFIPLSFERYIENGKKIKLTVEKIEVEQNRLIFKSVETKSFEIHKPQNPINSISPVNIFSQGEKYVFNVNGFRIIDENTSILLVENQGFASTVKAFDFQNENNLPEKVTCLVSQVLENKIYLQQDRFSIFTELYIEGRQYEFDVVSVENDSKTNAQYYLLEDNYGFNHKLYYHEFDNSGFDNIKIGNKQSLYLRKIDEKGHLVLYLSTLSSLGKFVTVNSVFESINQSNNLNKYFFDFEEVLKTRTYKYQPFSELFEDYKNKENLWIFSYLSFLEALIQNKIKKNELTEAIEFNDIYLAIEEWMLEGSDFLQKFSPDKRQNIILKAEYQFEKAKARKEALLLIVNQKSDLYIQDVLKTLRLSNYLRGNKINVFKYIIFSTTEIANTKTSTIIEIILLLIKGDLLDSFDSNNFIGLLQKRINIERYDLSPSFITNKSTILDQETKNALQNIISVLGLQIFLFNQNSNTPKAIIKSAMMCRYISFLCTNETEKLGFLIKGIDCITSSKSIDLKPDLYYDFNLEKLINTLLIKETSLNTETLIGNQIFKQNGSIYSTKNGWAILSKQQDKNFNKKKDIKLNKLASFFDDKICVATPFDINIKLINNKSIVDCSKNWRSYYTATIIDDSKNNNRNSNVFLGQKISVIAKNYLKDNNNILFLQITDPGIEGDGIIPLKEIFRCQLDGINEILNPKDEFNAEIIKIDEKGRITFSILEEIWNKTILETKINDSVDAKVIQIVNKDVFLITENGHLGYLYNNDNLLNIEERKVYKFKIEEIVQEKKSLFLKYVANTDRYFNEKNVLRKFLKRSNIIKANEDFLKDDEGSSQNYHLLIYELLQCIDVYTFYVKDNAKKIEYFELSKLLSSLTKNPKSFYFEALINYYLNIYNFKNADYNDTNFNFEPLDEKITSVFKNLESINETYKYLSYFNKSNSIQELISIRNEVQNTEVVKLINVILAQNLLVSDQPDELIFRRTKDLIYEYLTNEKVNTFNNLISPTLNEEYIENENENEVEVEEEQSLPSNLGKEGTYREFKTSFIYYAGSNSADIEKQSFVIMKTIAGFLNAKGGSLFIGVNDNGDIIGLENEYKYFSQSTNGDKYEREIRSVIVKNFNKDVNSQIEFKFHKSINFEYCEVIIPEYEKPIPLKDNFYQRQGNETRIINGHDLVLFFERKLQSNLISDRLTFNINKETNKENNSKSYPHLEETVELDLFQENPDFYIDQKSDNNQLIIDYNNKTPKILAHLYIFINGKYLLSSKKLIDFKGAEEIVIYDNMKKGFLLQCYDNGCVNKVEVRTLLDKTFSFLHSGAFSNEGNLIGLFLIKEDCLIVVNSTRSDVRYVKIFKSSNVTTHTHLKLKGNNIIQEDFDKLDSFKIIDNIHNNKLSRIIYTSKQRLGVKVDNPSYKEEINYLTSL